MNRAMMIGLFLIIFNLSIPVIASLGVFSAQPIVQSDSFFSAKSVGNVTTEFFSSYLSTGLGLVTVIGAALAGLIFRVPIGALVYAAVFTVSTFPLSNILYQLENQGFLTGPFTALISSVVAFMFLIGFIEVSS